MASPDGRASGRFCSDLCVVEQKHPRHRAYPSGMDWKLVAGDRERFRAAVQGQWARLTDAHLETIAGNRMELTARIRAVYAISQEQAEKQVAAWAKRASALVQGPAKA
jgi:uncharacterized protein YjbJ (UPF0337 family)